MNYNKNFNNKKPLPKLPEGYLNGGYYKDKEKSNMKEDYVVKFSKQIAECLSSEGREKNKSTQLRKYYDYTIRIKNSLRYENNFDKVLPEIKRLSYFSEYAKTRGKVSNLFVDFINKNVEAINDTKDFLAFSIHFEAIIAYLPKD